MTPASDLTAGEGKGPGCGFESFGWVCDGSGVLSLAAGRGTLGTPCPRCRTEAYLTRAWNAALAEELGADTTCTCCPGRSGLALWQIAVEAARSANAEATARLLPDFERHFQQEIAAAL
jgi:hypothetical protein